MTDYRFTGAIHLTVDGQPSGQIRLEELSLHQDHGQNAKALVGIRGGGPRAG